MTSEMNVRRSMSSVEDSSPRTFQFIHEPTFWGVDDAAMCAGLEELKQQGIGGIVTNVSFHDYLVSGERWEQLRRFVRCCASLNLRIWIYDEKGYPSGTAGGRVLAGDPTLEASALAMGDGEVIEQRAYEGTHASDNYAERRRYINLLEPRATAAFLNVTHQAYRERLAELFQYVEAFFTDEPALNVLNIGTLGGELGERLPVHDPVDPSVTRLPMIAWSRGIEERIDRASAWAMFGDDRNADALKRRYYHAVGEAVSEAFFGQIQRWCRENGVRSSGHLLWEEELLLHPALYGNALRCMLRFDIPGIDVLDSNPASSFRHSQRATLLASSAAMLNGTRRVMSETSDINQILLEKRLASVAEAENAVAWQAAMGVTDFMFYYTWGGLTRPHYPIIDICPPLQTPRTPEDYRQINDFTQRLTAQLESCTLRPDVFLYYPIELIQQHFVPAATRDYQFSKRSIEIRDAFTQALEILLGHGIVPCLVDGEMICDARTDRTGVHIMSAVASSIVVPAGCMPPTDVVGGEVAQRLIPLTADSPKELFARQAVRIHSSNPHILALPMDAEELLRVTCVNLSADPQSTRITTAVDTCDISLEPLAVTVLDFPAR